MHDRDPNQRIVVTGIGSVTPLGLNTRESWEKAVAGQHGFKFITRREPGREVTFVGGSVESFSCEGYLPAKILRNVSQFAQFALVAGIEAGLDAKVLQTSTESGLIKPTVIGIPAEQIGSNIGTATGGATFTAEIYKRITMGSDRFHPFSLDLTDPNRANNILHLVTGIGGPGGAIVAACATSEEASIIAAMMIAHSQIDSRFPKVTGMFTGGAEALLINTIGYRGYQGMTVYTQERENLDHASKPFNKKRGGVVIGDGSVVLFMETLANALERRRLDPSIHIYGEILGAGDNTYPNTDSKGQTDKKGVIRVIQQALENSKTQPEEINLVVAHATATVSDITEGEAINEVFEDHKPAVTAPKSWGGHMQGAAGADGIKTALLSIRDSIVPPILGLTDPEVAGLNYVRGKAREMKVRKVLVNAFGIGGKNTCMVIGEYTE